MLYIEGNDYSKYLSDYSSTQVVRGEEVVETLAGTMYSYGTGKGYEGNVTLSLVPTNVMNGLMNSITGAGKTFCASFPGGGTETEDRLCKATDVACNLQNMVDDGHWSVTFTIVTVD